MYQLAKLSEGTKARSSAPGRYNPERQMAERKKHTSLPNPNSGNNANTASCANVGHDAPRYSAQTVTVFIVRLVPPHMTYLHILMDIL